MSFSNKVKENILSLKFQSKCCKKAFFYGAMMGADISDGNICVSITNSKSVDLLTYIASTVFKIKEIDISESSRGFYSTTQLTFSLPTVISLLQSIDGGSTDAEQLLEIINCTSCSSHFFGGLFCACGTISDPSKDYYLEFGLPNHQRAECLMSLFRKSTDLHPKIRKRKNGYGVFSKSSEDVSGFLTLCQTNTVIFDFFNQQLENQLKNDVQRATNFVTSNIMRSVQASEPQKQAIERLIASGKFSMLSDELKQSAELRLENPELSLQNLAALHNPPITKSGLSHRMEKIINLSKDI